MCPGCYKPDHDTYCPNCCKLLFDGKKVSHILSFDTPADDNLSIFQEKTKRLSISGVQLKYSLRLEGNELVLTNKGGQYILKPIPPGIQIAEASQAPENEHLTMQIASRAFRLDTASNALIYFKDGSPAYITRRFDVKEDGSKYPQEDMAQLSGRSKQTVGENFKYEGTYEEIGGLISKYVTATIPDLENLFKVVVFNYVMSNGDAHLKNFSLVQGPMGDYHLSRAYDLMSTVLHMPNESDTALDLYKGDMNVDNEFYAIHGCYGQPHFRELGRRLGLMPVRIERILTNVFVISDEVRSMISDSFLSEKAKKKYLEAYNKKLKMMGLTKTIIFPYQGDEKDVCLTFIRGENITGRFQSMDKSGVLEKDNKYLFIETDKIEQYKKTHDPQLLTLVDGDMLVNIELQ
ncbi:serine/threonine-protein kinase HipA [Chitinophaga sp. YR573]|uniref:HipA domain-containing protein n=1 Tax=Chitinophaga sp. YR573 TaxID=1881040 RepID=UPI0008BB66E4|nr:HipA domain-containing protein [Chitinophaga sp. YR573]SEV90687.1 serine/threonine-protein kinase HipA [Chitinophaga sp. YR573]